MVVEKLNMVEKNLHEDQTVQLNNHNLFEKQVEFVYVVDDVYDSLHDVWVIFVVEEFSDVDTIDNYV